MTKQHIRYRVMVYCDTELEAATPQAAWKIVTNQVQEIVDREYADQLSGRESDPETDDFLYGLTLRLPGSMIVTGLDVAPGYDDHDEGYDDAPRRPELQVLRGGKV